MYIKSIVLDGFKSYGNRVEVTGFDPELNVITGLNGTGKSNILDSICFVLGITNLSNAGSLQELIYKHGQAGITKASVSITFDIRDKRHKLVGYENHNEIIVTREVVMGGKNKYLINGINVQNKQVREMFYSVQLNVNNPDFLILQGRIAKVLNMTPPEILSMVKEAAGIRMYESVQHAIQKTRKKEDAKLRKINDKFREDIAPKIQKLLDKRSQFKEYQQVVRELVVREYIIVEENAKQAVTKVTEIEDTIKMKKMNIKKNQKEVKVLYKEVAELNKNLDKDTGNILKQLETELQNRVKAKAEAETAVRAAKKTLTTHEMKSMLDASAVKELHTKIKQLKEEIAYKNSEISRRVQLKKNFLKCNSDLKLKIKELEYKIKELQTKASVCEKRLKNMETENPWILSEKQYFGQAGGAYDFVAEDVAVTGARVAQLTERRDRLARRLKAARTLLEKVKTQNQDLMLKKNKIKSDRDKLMQMIAKLDEKKRRMLVTASVQGNKNFGSIFSTLLPGAQAKLIPPHGKSVLEGLEMKVGFNNAWKESLGELSGGQRSLAALSLVLAMLLIKPAPLYILSEVDAELDLSHTQNFAQVLKEHFKHSQFIIVSHKDGMFNNANVLFHTKFMDGMSSVQRTVNSRR